MSVKRRRPCWSLGVGALSLRTLPSVPRLTLKHAFDDLRLSEAAQWMTESMVRTSFCARRPRGRGPGRSGRRGRGRSGVRTRSMKRGSPCAARMDFHSRCSASAGSLARTRRASRSLGCSSSSPAATYEPMYPVAPGEEDGHGVRRPRRGARARPRASASGRGGAGRSSRGSCSRTAGSTTCEASGMWTSIQ